MPSTTSAKTSSASALFPKRTTARHTLSAPMETDSTTPICSSVLWFQSSGAPLIKRDRRTAWALQSSTSIPHQRW
jgi:hypothetical protein